ncbi:MAG TPA: type II secretion system protein [Verrucomicrobiae bacterium]|nr:type II secretion system protein [Verrucomicrobiae bacterium]
MTKRGFTIIELMVTMLIIGILMTAAAAGIVRARRTSRDAQRVRDVMAIGTAVDQATTAARGLYPVHVTSRTTGIFCADLLSDVANSNKLNLGLFLGRTIPKDPLPESAPSPCADYRNGYTYHNRYGSPSASQLAEPLSGQQYEYVIEVGLEGEQPADAETLVQGAASSTKRTQWLLRGKPCSSVTATATCSQ